MHARPIRSSLGPDPNGSAPVCTGPKLQPTIPFLDNISSSFDIGKGGRVIQKSARKHKREWGLSKE